MINIDKVRLVVTIIGIGMFLSLLYYFILNNYWGVEYPHNTFLFLSEDNFMDFYNVNYFVDDFSPYSSNKNISYPPFALLIAYPFSLFFQYTKYGSPVARENFFAVSSYLILFFFFSWFLLKEIYQTIKSDDKWKDSIYTFILFFTYPVFFLFDRGNYLMLTFVFLYLFVYYCYTCPKLSLVCLSAAIAMKIYPVFFLLLFLVEKRWKDIGKVIFWTGCFSIIPLFLFRGSFFDNLVNFLTHLFSFSGGYDTEIANMAWNLSLLGIIKIPIMLFNQGEVPYSVEMPYLLLGILLVSIVIYLLIKETRLSRKITYLLALQLLIMPLSIDYALVFLYIPLLLLLGTAKLEHEDYLTMVIIALLFIPKTFVVLFYEEIAVVTIQNIVNPILLLLLIFLPFYRQMKGKLCKRRKKV